MSSNFRTIFFLTLLGGVGAVAYWPALTGYFLSDDFVHVLYMQRVDEDFHVLLKNFWSNWLDVPTTLFFRPLVSVTLYLDHFLWGWNASGYHLTNVVMHAANGMLIFLIARRLVLESASAGNGVFAFLGAVLFLVWPLNVEAVYWIIGRVDVQLTLFYLSSFYFFIRYFSSNRVSHYWLVFCLFAFVAALSTKEPAVTLPAVLVVYCFFYNSHVDLNFSRRLGVAFRLTAPVWGVLAAYFLWRKFSLGTFGGGYTGGDIDYSSANYWRRWKSLIMLILPINRAWPESVESRHIMTWLFGVGWFCILYTIFYSFSRDVGRVLKLGGGAFVLSLLPLMTVFHVAEDLQSSRFLYLPAALFWIALASSLERGRWKKSRSYCFFGIFAAILLLGTASAQLRLNLAPWIQASDGIRVFSKDLDRLVAQRSELGRQGQLLVLAGIPDNIYGAQFLRNGYGGFLGTAFRHQPINNLLPLTDDDRTGVMPIFAKRLAQSDDKDVLYGVFRYFPDVGIRRVVAVNQKNDKATGGGCRVSGLGDQSSGLRRGDGDWLVSGGDPFLVVTLEDCFSDVVGEMRVAIDFRADEFGHKGDSSLQLFWRARNQEFAENRSIVIPLVPHRGMHEYVFAVGDLNDWANVRRVDAIRLDFPEIDGARIKLGGLDFVLNKNGGGLIGFERDVLKSVASERMSYVKFNDSDGVLSLGVSKKDEFVLFPMRGWNPVEGDAIVVRMRVVDSDRNVGYGKFYWVTEGSPNFSEDKSVEFPVKADGDWHVLTIPVSHLPAWWTSGRGRQLRMNPFYGRGEVQIERVAVVTAQPRPVIKLGNPVGFSSNPASSVFQRASRRRGDVLEFFYDLGLNGRGRLEVSSTPFNSPNSPDGSGVIELVRPLVETSGVISISATEFTRGPGTRYFRLVEADAQGVVGNFSSDPIAVLIED